VRSPKERPGCQKRVIEKFIQQRGKEVIKMFTSQLETFQTIHVFQTHLSKEHKCQLDKQTLDIQSHKQNKVQLSC